MRRLALLVVALVPFVVGIAQSPAPTAEQVFEDVQVFKGVPASDMIPAMQFMSASLGYTCNDCHVPGDYGAPHKNKDEARKMVLMQREINEKHFNGRLEVTCMTCHNQKDHPNGMPLPAGVTRRHVPMSPPPKPADIIAQHLSKAGKFTAAIVRTGTLTGPNDLTHKMETNPLEFIQAPDGKFVAVSGARKFGFDGTTVHYYGGPITDEPAAIFTRIGRTWLREADFAGLSRMQISGTEKVGKTDNIVVQGFRAATSASEELYFDQKSHLLNRLVNFRRSTIGTVVSAIDYSNYKKVGEAMVPMKVVVTYADSSTWTMDFKTAKLDPKVDDAKFKPGS